MTIVDEFGRLLTYGFNIVESGQCHITIKIGCGRSWVNREYLNRSIALLEFNGHNAHHGILSSLAGYVGKLII